MSSYTYYNCNKIEISQNIISNQGNIYQKTSNSLKDFCTNN